VQVDDGAAAAAKASPEDTRFYYADAAFLTAPASSTSCPTTGAQLCSGLGDRVVAACDRRQSSGTCENAAGADLTGQGESGKVQLRYARRRHAATFGGELLKKMAGIEWTHVPYKGAAAVVPDVIGGRFRSGSSAQRQRWGRQGAVN